MGQQPATGRPAAQPTRMPGTFRIGRVLGFDVVAHWSWLIVVFLLSWSIATHYLPDVYPEWTGRQRWSVGFAVSLLFFASMVAHELAHSVMARRRGIAVTGITLFVFGGVSGLSDEPASARDEFQIAIVGPLTSIVIAAVFGVLRVVLQAADVDVLYPLAGYLAVLNLGVGLFNLVPGFPLDGGRVVRALVWAARHDQLEATRVASVVGRGVAGLIIFVGIIATFSNGLFGGLWFILTGWFLWHAAETSYSTLVVKQGTAGVTVAGLVDRDVPRVAPDTTLEVWATEQLLAANRRAFFVAPADTGGVLGLVTLSDLQKHPREQWAQTSVYRAMTPADRLVTTAPETDAMAALELMAHHNVNQLAIVERGEITGLVSRADLLQAIELRLAVRREGMTIS